MKVNVLIIDDHPIIIEVNQIALREIAKSNDNIKFKVKSASNADEALAIIKSTKDHKKIDLVLLDIRIDPSSNQKILSGEDLGLLLRKKFSDVKIIVITSFNNNFRLNSILTNIDPDGLMIKTNLTSETLKTAIEAVLRGETYYCSTVSKLIRTQYKSNIFLDETDRAILHHLSIGTKMKEMPNHIPLSMGGIESRKRKLAEAFDIPPRNVRLLILKAKEMGFI